MLQVKQFVFNHFDENTYLAVDTETRQAAVIDPGMLTGQERTAFENFIKDNNITLTQVILTHGHLDHCFGADFVRNRYGVPVKVHTADAPLAAHIHEQGKHFGLGKLVDHGVENTVTLKDGDVIEIGNSRLEVIHVPGHSPGGIALYDKADGLLFSGDSLFRGSIGRTDLEGGDHKTLLNSLRNRILTLPDDTLVLPGHGNFTRTGIEKSSNPYLA